MPHLRYRDEIMWRVSGDEFFIPALFSLVGRSFWLILLILLLALYFPQLNSCVESQLILFFLFFSIVFSGLLICTDLAIAFVSLRGSIGEVNYRKPLIPLFLVRAILSVLLVLATVVGIVGLSMNGRVPCGATIETTKVNEGIMAFIIPTQFFDLLVSFCCLFGCRVRHSEFREVEVDDASSIHSSLYDKENKSVPSIQTINESVVDRWEQSINRGVKVMRYLGCSNLGGGNVTEGFEDVARVFSKLFYHEGFVDIVVSDIVAGIILVRYEQLTQRKDAFQNLQEQQQNQTGQNFPFWNVSNSSDDIDIQYEFTSSGVDSKANQESNDITAERIAKDGNADKNKREGVGKKVTLLPQGVVREVVSDFVEQTNTLIQDETQEPQQSTTDARNSIREQQGNSNSVDLPMLRDIGKTALLASYLYSKTYTLPTTETSHGETSGNATTSKTWKSSLQHCFDLLCFNVTSMCHRAPMAGMAYCCGFWCGSKLDQRGDNATSNSISKRFGKETSHLEQNFHGINFLALDYTNLPTFLERISGTELIYISTQYAENDVYHKPYAVFIDHSERRIIVAIRGTMSIEDAVTDVMCNPEEVRGS